MVEFWSKVLGKTQRPTREEVESVLAREQAEATRQRLEAAMRSRRNEIEKLVGGVLPERTME